MENREYNLIIIGAGPAGLTAAQYGARANLKVLVIGQLGGQASLIDNVENYPGNISQVDDNGNVVSPPKSGYELCMDFYKQACAFGAEFLWETVTSINKKENSLFELELSDGNFLKAASVIIAAGAKPRLLNVPGEKEFTGKGVSYCATCDGNFFKGKKMIVAGGGDAACDEAKYLSRLTNNILMVHRRGELRAQKALAERTMKNPNIQVRFNTVIKEIRGDKKVKSVFLADVTDGREYEEQTDAVFIFAGTVPLSEFVKNSALNVSLDESGYIITDQNMATNVTGLYAAGDIRSGAFRQIITAASDGAVAAHNAAEFIDRIGT